MENLRETDCKINRVIVHIVDRTNTNPILFDTLIDMASLPRAFEPFLQAHIAHSINRSAPAKFDDTTQNPVCIHCEKSFTDPDTCFIPASQQFATLLHAQMLRKNTKPGTLWILLFEDTSAIQTGGTTNRKGLALLKMDNQSGVSHRVITENGKQTLKLELSEQSLPQTTAKLNKAAFFFPQGGEFGYDLRVLDQNLGGNEVAQYFSDFLGYTPLRSPRQNTTAFIQTVQKFGSENKDELRLVNAQNLLAARLNALRNEEIEIAPFVESVLGTVQSNDPNAPTREALHQKLESTLRSAIKSDQFTVDTDIRLTQEQKVILELTSGSHKVLIQGSRQDIEFMIPEYDKLPSGEGSITIHFEDWSA